MCKCDCNIESGWCNRHKINKSKHWVKLCKTKEKYFTSWENGKGPGQQLPTTLSPLVVPLKMPIEREEICLVCEHYNYFRCSKMDLGCRQTFLQVANNPTETCPLKKWPIPLD